jgi:hypothetical protein
MEANIQVVVNSLTRQISELAVKLAVAEAEIDALRSQNEKDEE